MCIPLSRVPLVGSSIDEWLETTAHMKHAHDVHRKPKVLHASVDGAPPNTYSDPVYFWKASIDVYCMCHAILLSMLVYSLQ